MALPHNPHITEKGLAELHEKLAKWALFCSDFDTDLANDSLQQTYLKVIAGKAVFKRDSSLKTWMFSILRYTVFEIQRKHKPTVQLGGEENFIEDPQECPPDEINLGYLYSTEEVESALNKLPLLQREIIFLAFYYENSLSEIARILGVSLGTVRSEYHKAKVKIKLLLCSDSGREVQYEEKYN